MDKTVLLFFCNMCKQYLYCTVKCWHLFDVIENANVKLYNLYVEMKL